MTTQNNEEQKKTSGLKRTLVVVGTVAVLTGVGYAAYKYIPGFRSKVQDGLKLIGLGKKNVVSTATEKVAQVTTNSNPNKFIRTYKDAAGTVVRTMDKVNK